MRLELDFLLAEKYNDLQIYKLCYFQINMFSLEKKDQNTPNISKKIKITWHLLNEDGTYELWKTHDYTFNLDRNHELYKESQDEDAWALDVSNFIIPRGFKSGMRHMNMAQFLDYNYEDVLCGQEITFVGYPSIFYDKKNYLPVMRKWSIASIPVVDFDWRKRLLVDAQVFPWSSGSPVFFLDNHSQYRLLWIMSEAVRKELDFVKIIPASKLEEIANIPIEWIWIGLVIKKEIIESICEMHLIS